MLVLALAQAFAQGAGGFISPGPLARAHGELDTLTGCTSCHEPFRSVAPARCLACHDRVRQQVRNNKGFHANKGESCQGCHSDHRGPDFNMIRLNQGDFDHETETGFRLSGAHADAACSDCHLANRPWGEVPTDCAGCHTDVHGADLSKRDVLDSCELCHDDGGWRTRTIRSEVFDHTEPRHTDYVLEGAHLDRACDACHFDARFLPTPHDSCSDCHTNPHRAPFGNRCESCHGKPTSWKVPGFDHGRTRFALLGEHARVACRKCHGGHASKPVAHETCSDCHEDIHSGQFQPDPCSDCHEVTIPAFAIPGFDHTATAFPLRGRHKALTCDTCHGRGPEAVYRGKPHEDCDSCHSDPHEAQFEPTPCAVCHAEDGWAQSDFDHSRTGFPLDGAHTRVECESCHPGGRYTGTPDTCQGCHTETPHPATLQRECTECHQTTGFSLIAFAHATATRFDPGPAHAKTGCEDCHTGLGDFRGLDSGCNACHRADRPWGHYDGDCDSCHQGAAWLPAGLGEQDHDVTGFALSGRHRQAACEDCHPTGQPRGSTPTDCVGCHTGDDPHRNLLGDACEDCHDERTWFRTRFRHFRTGWPLLGQHRLASCNDCHATGFIGTPTDCWRCHEAQAPPDEPAHASAFFVACDTCHVPYTWTAVRFAH